MIKKKKKDEKNIMHAHFSIYTGMGTNTAYMFHSLVKYFSLQVYAHVERMFDLSSDVNSYLDHCCVFANH